LDKSCDIVNTRVFSSRRQLRRYKIRQRKRQKRRKNRRVKRDQRSLLAVSEPKFWPKWCHKVAFFRVFRKDLTLCLYSKRFSEDPILAFSNPRLGTTIYGYADKKYYSELGTSRALRYVTGYVLGHSFSGVQGYVWNHRFYGSIYVRKSVLFVEPIVSNNQIRFPYYVPSARRTVRKKGSLNAYVYKIYSRKMKRRKKNKKSFNVEPRTSPNHLFSGDKFFFTSRWKHTATYSNHHHPRPPPPRTKETSCKTCSLILVADYEFFRDVGEGSIKKTVHTMLYHVRQANLLMRATDFNSDGRSDCLGIHVKDIRLITDPRVSVDILGKSPSSQFSSYWTWGIPSSNIETTPEEYIRTFSRSYLDRHCLGILFSNKSFPKRVLGLAWRGDPSKHSGICQKRQSGSGANLNSLFITLRTSNMERIPLQMGILNLLHEILHAFGASHDPKDNLKNSPEGRYLMSRYSNSGTKENHSRLSQWSKESIQEILQDFRMSYCLHDMKSAFCGDGIVQPGEDCDCGLTEDCLAKKSCCVQPGGGPKNQQECSYNSIRQIMKQCTA